MVIYSEWPSVDAALTAGGDGTTLLLLERLDEPQTGLRLDQVDADDATAAPHGEAFRLTFSVYGQWTAAPGYAVYALWQVSDPAHAAAFVASRQQLFAIRQQVLPTFAFDWLLESRERPHHYLIVGCYGDKEGARRCCREHPEIQSFARNHPAASMSASDLTGARACRVHTYHASAIEQLKGAPSA